MRIKISAIRLLKRLGVVILLSGLLCSPALAKDEVVGKVVILRGKALIHSGSKTKQAKRKDPLKLSDIIETKKRSRAKMVFLDDSMLTLGPNSKASIEKFVYSKEGGGASIFNLLDGAMRSVVGKTAFEVHTTTSVAAARGTVIDFLVGTKKGRPFTKITCQEGVVEVKSADPNITGMVPLNPGQSITVFLGMDLPKPDSAALRQRIQRKGPGVDGDLLDGGDTAPSTPPIDQEPTVETIPVTIDVEFPQ